jgi:hypothetical protein
LVRENFTGRYRFDETQHTTRPRPVDLFTLDFLFSFRLDLRLRPAVASCVGMKCLHPSPDNADVWQTHISARRSNARPLIPRREFRIFHTPSALLKGYANRCLGIENKKGTLWPGADADLVVLDRQGNVVSTWVKGRQV